MAGYNQQGGYQPQNNPQQPVGGNYPQGPYQGPPVGGNYPQGPYQGPPVGGNYPQGPYQGPPVGGNYPRGPYQGPPQGPVPYPPQYGGQGPNPYGMANPQMGITPGIVTAGFWLALLGCTSMPGIICCAIGMAEAKRRQAGEGLALAGIIIGISWQVIGAVLYVGLSVAEASGSL